MSSNESKVHSFYIDFIAVGCLSCLPSRFLSETFNESMDLYFATILNC